MSVDDDKAKALVTTNGTCRRNTGANDDSCVQDEDDVQQQPQWLELLQQATDTVLACQVQESLSNQGYYVLPGILTEAECDQAVSRVDEFDKDTLSGGAATSKTMGLHTSHGAGFVLGHVRECLAERVFAPLYGTTALHASKEGFVQGGAASSSGVYYEARKDDSSSSSSSCKITMIRSLAVLRHGNGDGNKDDAFFRCGSPTSSSQASPLLPGSIVTESDIAHDSSQECSGTVHYDICLRRGDVLLWRSDTSLSVPLQSKMLAAVCSMLPARLTPKTVVSRKMDAYKERRTGSHQPQVEVWYDSPNAVVEGATTAAAASRRRQFFRTSPPLVTVRQAQLYGLVPYEHNDDDDHDKLLERALIRGVRFINDSSTETISIHPPVRPCSAKIEKLLADDAAAMEGTDKWLGGMASPCGRYIYGVPGTAHRVLRITTTTNDDGRSSSSGGSMDCIGPEFAGKFKWLRGVEVPAVPAHEKAYPSGCCLALPCNHASILKVDPHTSNVYAFGQDVLQQCGATNWLYHGGNLASNGWIYAIPANAERVLKFHPFTDEVLLIGPVFQGKAKWYGGIVGSDGCIWGVPHNHSMVLRIDPRTDQVTLLGQGTNNDNRQPLPDGRWKWHGGLRAGDKIIGFPNNSDSVLVINCSNKHVYTIGDSSILKSGRHRIPQDNRYKYLGGALTQDGRYAYLFPCDAEQVLRVDCVEDKGSLVGPLLLEGENKFQNGFVGRDGALYGIPQRSSGVLRIVPGYERGEEDHVDIMDCGADLIGVKDKFEGGVLGADGCIYCIPLRGK